MLLDEEFALLAGHAHGRVIVDDVAPAVMGDQPVGGGEVDAGLPFRRRDVCLGDGRDLDVGVHGFGSAWDLGLRVGAAI